MNEKYTSEQLLKEYRGKYIKVCPTYDYETHKWLYEVVGVKDKIHEEYNLPEDCILQDWSLSIYLENKGNGLYGFDWYYTDNGYIKAYTQNRWELIR